MIYEYFIGHKPFEMPSGIDGIKLQVGSLENFGDVRDSSGDSISEKNPNYCELTALYWIWKNECPKLNPDDLIGINHYRRWFSIAKNPQRIEEALQSADIILPVFEPYRETVREQYCIDSGFERDLIRTRTIMEKIHPGDAVFFDEVMSQGGIHQYNMMIATVTEFSDYCSWLFPILSELEKQTDLRGYNDYQKRIYGFLSERLVNVWVKSRHLRVAESKVIQPEMKLSDRILLFFRQKRNQMEFKRKTGHACRESSAG